MKQILNQTSPASSVYMFLKSHQLAVGLWLVFFGVADLTFIVPTLYGTLGNWHVAFWQPGIYFSSRWLVLVPFLLVMTLLGTALLAVYCIRGIKSGNVDDKEHAAVLVTALGFTYLVAGAWPLWTQLYPFPWQMEIASYGNPLSITLYIGAVAIFFTGAASLYLHSRLYHQKLAH